MLVSSMLRTAPKTNFTLADANPGEWKDRSDKWAREIEKSQRKRPVKRRNKIPLILAGHGVSLRIERNTLVVKNGLTHYPQEQEIVRFFPGELDLPPRIIFLDCSGSISFSVVNWLQEQDIDLVHLNWQGEIVMTTSKTGYSADFEKVIWQRETFCEHERRMAFSIGLIARKFEQSLDTLHRLNYRNDAWKRAVDFLEASGQALFDDPPRTIRDLLMIEANCAVAYFRAWNGVTLAWKGKSRKFIPDHWNAFDQRSSDNNLTGNRRADHPINAMLNYAYRVAESELLIQAISEGFDPTIGILHELKANRKSFLHDAIELERAEIDFQIFNFVRSNVLAPDDFVITQSGAVRLNPQLARYLAKLIIAMPRVSISEKLGLEFDI
jgi:CRISPR-associated protein Cas1